MNNWQAGALGFFLGLMVATSSADAQTPQCAAHDDVMNGLAVNFAETRQSIGMASDQTLMELYANTDAGSWTLIVTLPNGMSCLVASGTDYETVKEALPPAGEPG